MKDSLENKRIQREALARLKEALSERRKLIETSAFSVPTDFWCDVCKTDVQGIGMKEVRVIKGTPFFAFYRTPCPKGHWCIRRITDAEQDPYFFKSTYVKKLRVLHGDDMLDPSHPWFRWAFPLQWEQREKQKDGYYLSNSDLWK